MYLLYTMGWLRYFSLPVKLIMFKTLKEESNDEVSQITGIPNIQKSYLIKGTIIYDKSYQCCWKNAPQKTSKAAQQSGVHKQWREKHVRTLNIK